MEAAAQFLAVRPRSISETSRRLRHLGYPDALVDDVLDQLVVLGYLDDAGFAQAWVQSRDRSKPRGEMALRRELAVKGVPREVVADVLANRSETANGSHPESDAARALLGRKRAALEREADPIRRRQKVYALLARNGFDPQVCREITAEFVSSDDSDE